jgi:hypothetical protein
MVLWLLAVGALWVVSFIVARRSVRSRRVSTTLPPEVVRRLFVENVTGFGWRVAKDGNPLVAQSTLLAGRRQRVALTVRRDGDRTVAVVDVVRYAGQLTRVPVRPHTIRLRVAAFLRAVVAADPGARVE